MVESVVYPGAHHGFNTADLSLRGAFRTRAPTPMTPQHAPLSNGCARSDSVRWRRKRSHRSTRAKLPLRRTSSTEGRRLCRFSVLSQGPAGR